MHHQDENFDGVVDVLVGEDNMVPSKWPIARMIAINPSQDGLVRAVTVKTSIGQYRQPQF